MREALGQMGEPETRVPVARTIADHEQAAGRNPVGKAVEEDSLFVRPKIMQEIEEDDVAGLRDRLGHVLLEKLKVMVDALRDRVGPLDLAAVAVESADRCGKIPLAQIKGEQPDPAAEIDERLGRVAEELESGGKNWIAPQFAAGINAQPALAETGRDPGAGILMCTARRSIFRCVALLH